jgi:DNA-binding LytR/AlgR family response regulator
MNTSPNKKVYIVEDISIIRLMLEQTMIENDFEVVGSSATAEKAWKEINENKPDLVLLDINLVGEKSGIWLGQQIYEYLKIPFIYITAYQDHYTSEEILNTHPVGFIVKPINTIQLITTAKIALDIQIPSIKKQLLIQDGLKAFNLNLDDIYFIQSEGNYIHIFLEESHLLIRSTMESFIEKLPNGPFIRIHQRYVINKTKRLEYDNEQVYILGKALSVSSKYKKDLMELLR